MTDWASLKKRARDRLLRLHYETQTGHLGSNLSCLDILLYLHHHVLTEHDVFIMSKGHSACALYVTLWTLGKISEDELLTFYQDGTHLCGHATAEYNVFSTGSLGHGLSLAVGMATAKNSGRVYCLLSDGELSEGSTMEAVEFSYKQEISNLKILVDCNGWGGFSECRERPGYDGHDVQSLRKGFEDGSGMIFFKTIKGFGTCHQNTLESHYLPLTEAQYHEATLR